MFTDVSMVIRCYVSVSGDVCGYVCGVALCSPMCLWSSGVMCMCVVLLCGQPVLCVCERLCVWCCSVFTDVSMVIRCYVSVSGDVCGYVCGVALCSPMCLWSSGVMYL